MRKSLIGTLAALFITALAPPASAELYVLDSFQRGWIPLEPETPPKKTTRPIMFALGPHPDEVEVCRNFQKFFDEDQGRVNVKTWVNWSDGTRTFKKIKKGKVQNGAVGFNTSNCVTHKNPGATAEVVEASAVFKNMGGPMSRFQGMLFEVFVTQSSLQSPP